MDNDDIDTLIELESLNCLILYLFSFTIIRLSLNNDIYITKLKVNN